MQHDFRELIDAIIERKPDLTPCRPTVEKEILHMEILLAMRAAGHLRHLVFKGGTCLRLCRDGERLSEDLDFSCASDFDESSLDDLEEAVRHRLGATYGLDATVSRKSSRREPGRMISRWMVRVVTEPPPKPSSVYHRVQRIKVEIAPVDPPPPVSVAQARFPHRDVAMPSLALPIRAVPSSETFADKLVALPTSMARRGNPRYRDIWDINAIFPAGRTALDDAIRKARAKAALRGPIEEYEEMLRSASKNIRAVMDSGAMERTLRRFLPIDVADRTISDAEYREAVANTLSELFDRTRAWR